MSQRRIHSLREAIFNNAISFGLAYAINLAILPVFRRTLTDQQAAFWLTAIFSLRLNHQDLLYPSPVQLVAPQKMNYMSLYLGLPWVEPPKRKKIREAVREYYERTEVFDRTVCTGPVIRERIMPANGFESSEINRNAIAVRREILSRLEPEGITPREFQDELIGYRKTKP